jgi:hypothetical protein
VLALICRQQARQTPYWTCCAALTAYRRAGVDVPVVFPLTWGAPGPDALDSTLQAAIAPADDTQV